MEVYLNILIGPRARVLKDLNEYNYIKTDPLQQMLAIILDADPGVGWEFTYVVVHMCSAPQDTCRPHRMGPQRYYWMQPHYNWSFPDICWTRRKSSKSYAQSLYQLLIEN